MSPDHPTCIYCRDPLPPTAVGLCFPRFCDTTCATNWALAVTLAWQYSPVLGLWLAPAHSPPADVES